MADPVEVGSKVAPGSRDERPLARRLITRVFNGFLRIALGFKGSDTHGVKAFRRFFERWIETFPDVQVELEDTVGDGDRLLVLLRQAGAAGVSGGTYRTPRSAF